jgi:hypothetical protein
MVKIWTTNKVSVADCDSDHYLVVAKVRERLAVGKQLVKKMDV